MPERDKKAYEVGRGKPPKHTQFAKGTSGNPKGRPRKREVPVADSAIEAVFTETLGTASIQGKNRRITGHEAMVRGILRAALKGDVKAAGALMKLERKHIDEIIAQQGVRSASKSNRPGGFLLVPEILSIDEWEAIAVPSQQRLALATREGT